MTGRLLPALLAPMKMALVASNAEAAQAAEVLLRERYDFVPMEEAELIVALGGDGFLLHTLHEMLARGRGLPGIRDEPRHGRLPDERWRIDGLVERLERAKRFTVAPLEMKAATVAGETVAHHAINEVSLLRETRETALDRGLGQRPRGAARAGLRRRAGGDAGRLDRLQPLRQRADPAARTRSWWR